jgi:hypothetical protein
MDAKDSQRCRSDAKRSNLHNEIANPLTHGFETEREFPIREKVSHVCRLQRWWIRNKVLQTPISTALVRKRIN